MNITGNQRNPNIESMRVIAALAVVWLHVSVRVVYGDPSIDSSGWWAGNLIDSYSRWCVPLFVMISGALLLPGSDQQPAIVFWKKRLLRLLPALIFWTLVYFAFRAIFEPPFDLSDAFKSLIKGNAYYHTWYLYMLLGLTFVTPFLRQLVALFDRRILGILILGSFIIAATEYAYGGRILTFLPSFLPFIGYFLAGHYLMQFPIKLKRGLLFPIILLCGLAIVLATAALLPGRGVQAYDVTYSYHNLAVVIMSLSIFLLMIKAPQRTTWYHRIAPVTLGIYAIHPLWIWALGRLGIDAFTVHPAIGIPLTAMLAFGLSAFSAVLMAKIPLLKRVVC